MRCYRPGDRDGDLTAFDNAIPEWPRPSHSGFWPVRDEELPFWERLLGEEVRLYGIDPSKPGQRLPAALPISASGKGRSKRRWPGCDSRATIQSGVEFSRRFGNVRLHQTEAECGGNAAATGAADSETIVIPIGRWSNQRMSGSLITSNFAHRGQFTYPPRSHVAFIDIETMVSLLAARC